MKFDIESFQQLFAGVLKDIMEWLPSLLGAMLLLLIGWIAAFVIRLILGSILRRVGIDKIAEKTGIAPFMKSGGFVSPLSSLIARFVFWIILFLFLLAATESLGLGFVAGAFKSAVAFLPRLLASVLIILLGVLFSGLIGDALGVYADKSGIKSGAFVGKFVKYVLFVFVFIIALQQLGIETVLFSGIIFMLLAALLLSLAISFGLGNRELARNISAGFHARESFLPGTHLEFGEHDGKLVRIGAFKFMIETGAGYVSLPNHILTEEKILIRSTEDASEKE